MATYLYTRALGNTVRQYLVNVRTATVRSVNRNHVELLIIRDSSSNTIVVIVVTRNLDYFLGFLIVAHLDREYKVTRLDEELVNSYIKPNSEYLVRNISLPKDYETSDKNLFYILNAELDALTATVLEHTVKEMISIHKADLLLGITH